MGSQRFPYVSSYGNGNPRCGGDSLLYSGLFAGMDVLYPPLLVLLRPTGNISSLESMEAELVRVQIILPLHIAITFKTKAGSNI